MGLLRIAHEQPCNERSKLAALRLVNPIPPKTFKKLQDWQVNELVQTFDWLWEHPFEGRPFESFEHKGQVYITPREKFAVTSYAEWLTAVVYLFQAYYDTDTPRELSAARLVATLCRPTLCHPDGTICHPDERIGPPRGGLNLPPDWNGDYRQPFNEHLIEARAEALLDLPVGILAAIIQYFVDELNWLYDSYDVFDDSTPETVRGEPIVQEFDWHERLLGMKNLRYVVAEENILGNVNDVMKANINDVFDALERLKTKQNLSSRREDRTAARGTITYTYDDEND